jgi:hypothetical protein
MTPRPWLGITNPDWCICSDTPRNAMKRRTALLAAALLVLLTACQTNSGTPEGPAAKRVPTGAESAEPSVQAGPDPEISPLSDVQWNAMVVAGVWRSGCPVGRDALRRLDVNHWTFNGSIRRGAIVAHADAIDDIAEVLGELFEVSFPIAKMKPVEEYDGDVYRSLEANNTSAFNCRRPEQINAPVRHSPHANGRAVDINPRQNPWVDPRCQCWIPSKMHASRDDAPGKVVKDGEPHRLFVERGWIWQNIKVPDYMHFDTGYPSVPRDE